MKPISREKIEALDHLLHRFNMGSQRRQQAIIAEEIKKAEDALPKPEKPKEVVELEKALQRIAKFIKSSGVRELASNASRLGYKFNVNSSVHMFPHGDDLAYEVFLGSEHMPKINREKAVAAAKARADWPKLVDSGLVVDAIILGEASDITKKLRELGVDLNAVIKNAVN